MRHSIRLRLTLTFIGLAISPVLLVGFAVAWHSYAVQREQALRLQHHVAQRVSTEVGAFSAELKNELSVVGRVQGLARLDRDRQGRILSELLSVQHAFEELTLVVRDTSERTSHDRGSSPLRVRSSPRRP